MKKRIAGTALFFVSLWGWAYVLHLIPFDYWSTCPIFFTFGVGVVAGLHLLIWGPAMDC